MSVTRRIAFGAAASWFSRGVTILLGLVLMPVLFRYLPKEELGVWLLLGQSWAAMGILDLGFGITLTRRIAFAGGGPTSARYELPGHRDGLAGSSGVTRRKKVRNRQVTRHF